MLKSRRLLSPDLLPSTLWNGAGGFLSMPPILATAYTNLLSKYGLVEMALSRQYNESPIGGITQEDTDQHLAQAFDGSSARVQLAVIDPKDDANDASDAFIKCLSGNKLLVVDAPCGAGAATLTFLTVIAELREKKILPRVPLDVLLIGAEIAGPARIYAQELTEAISSDLAKQAIFIKHEFQSWDALSNMSTTDLVRSIVKLGAEYPKCLVVIANFSGFLHSKLKDAKPQIQELLRYSSGPSSLAVWIEPQTNKVTNTGGIFAEIADWTTKKLTRFVQFIGIELNKQYYATSDAKFIRPVKAEDTPRVHLAVISLSLK
ncbi:hypothetical protein [Parapedobacter defluvii]|uniref:hypothetical protein n=1 Tax=Parapedobacter defluvii TaxID=2045106 RepID=UPI00333FBE6A